uniref:Uncharacterized protein n=1 Tax=Anopheles christyi TaxID=43041 RepID=A0A182KI27_9DIPT
MGKTYPFNTTVSHLGQKSIV